MERIVIVDFNHMAHQYLFSQHRLSASIGGEVVDTTIQNGCIKNIHRWSNNGIYGMAVCFDSPVPSRKAYFAKEMGTSVEGDDAYKGKRGKMPDIMFKSITMCTELLNKAGVMCVKGNNYEADDLVKACIDSVRRDYGYEIPIDVITNDADLLPLVDNQVSVFIRSKKYTWAERKDLEKPHYVQVTPKNFQEFSEGLSAYKNFLVPYNTLLLQKLLRGDSSDNLSSSVSRLFPPKKYNQMVANMMFNDEQIDEAFRYGCCKEVFIDKKSGIVFESIPEGRDKSEFTKDYQDPEELENILNFVQYYAEVSDSDMELVLSHLKRMYKGMNLNQAYTGLGSISRKPAVLKNKIVGFNEIDLQNVVREIDIKLKLS